MNRPLTTQERASLALAADRHLRADFATLVRARHEAEAAWHPLAERRRAVEAALDALTGDDDCALDSVRAKLQDRIAELQDIMDDAFRTIAKAHGIVAEIPADEPDFEPEPLIEEVMPSAEKNRRRFDLVTGWRA